MLTIISMKTKKIPNKNIVFPVPKGYKFDTAGAIKIAREISTLRDKKENEMPHQCQCAIQ